MYKRKAASKKVKSKRPLVRMLPMKSVEVKHFDVNLSQSVTQAGVLTLLSQISQGVQDIQRVGIKVTFKSINMYVNVITKAASYSDDLRVILVMDKQGFNTPTINDILEPGTVSTAFAPLSQYNYQYLSRFRILYDKTFSLSGGTANTSFLIKKTIKLNTVAQYAGAATFSNQIYVLQIGNNNNILTYPTINITSRIRFTDD